MLKHRDIDVAEFRIDGKTKHVDYVKIIDDIFSPVNSKASLGAKIVSFNDWLANRCISNSREGAERLKKRYNVSDMRDLMIAQKGLSLSDHYWIDTKPYSKKWKDVNLFENRYSEEIGRIVFDPKIRLGEGLADREGNSPELTTGGRLRKCWRHNEKDGKNYLVKGGSGIYRQEPFNEYYAHLVLNALGFKHTPYHIRKDKSGEWVSMCPCLADSSREMVSAADIRRKYGIEKSYMGLAALAEKKACPEIKESLDAIIIIDYFIDNTDRHWDNFGILRDAVTGSWLEATPIYDNGYSLWNRDQVNPSQPSKNESFAEYNIDCLEMVDMSRYVKKLPDLEKIFEKAFSRFEHLERKEILRKGIQYKQQEIEAYIP